MEKALFWLIINLLTYMRPITPSLISYNICSPRTTAQAIHRAIKLLSTLYPNLLYSTFKFNPQPTHTLFNPASPTEAKLQRKAATAALPPEVPGRINFCPETEFHHLSTSTPYLVSLSFNWPQRSFSTSHKSFKSFPRVSRDSTLRYRTSTHQRSLAPGRGVDRPGTNPGRS